MRIGIEAMYPPPHKRFVAYIFRNSTHAKQTSSTQRHVARPRREGRRLRPAADQPRAHARTDLGRRSRWPEVRRGRLLPLPPPHRSRCLRG